MSAVKCVPSFETGPDDLGAALALLRVRLAGPRQEIEQVFLDMGRQLLDSVRLLNEISAAHEGMPAELESEDFAAAARLLAAIRDEVIRMATAHTGENNCLDRLAHMAQSVSAPLEDLRKAVRIIRLVAVNARIAAAYIAGSTGELEAFTTDMMELGQSVEGTVSTFAEAHERFMRNLADARSANATFAERHGATMERISTRLAEHLARVDAHRERGRTDAREHAALTGRIRSRIGDAVSALQIDDITRQRIEHIEHAFGMLGEHVSDRREEGATACRHTIAATCRLTVAQLEETLLEFEREIFELAQSLDRLSSDAAEVLVGSNREAEAALSDGNTALGAMVSDLGEIRMLFRDFATTRAGIETLATEVVRSVALMTDRLTSVAEIEKKIRLLSLNTAMQCGRLGEDGRALRVVAQDMRDIAEDTVVAASAILSGLAGADELAHTLVEGESANLARRISSLETEAGTAIDLFIAVADRLRGYVGTMTATGPRAVSQLQAVAGHVSGRRDLGANWRVACEDIWALSPQRPEEIDIASLDVEFFARLRACYTMDSERQIHDALLGRHSDKLDEEVSAETEDSDLDDLFL